MQSVLKQINNVQTRLIICGSPFDCNGSDVIICVTGNPGVPDFYVEFAKELHKNTGLPVCVIGQAGHGEVPDKESDILENREHLFNLKGQLEHKLDLIENFIDKKSRLHLVGHSIGAWLLAELLHKKEYLIKRVSSINFLFPTLQKMAETKNGKYLNGFLRRIHVFVILFFKILCLLPESVILFLVNIYLKFKSLPPQYKERISRCVSYKLWEKVLFLAYNEMDNVTLLNVEAIDKIKHLTNVIYSTNDDWAPINYMEDLRIFQPQLQMKEVNINHAFVLESSETVAELVSQFIETKIE